ncbi:MAG: hypothetical protein A3E01_04560 [Gammaproteobacteria bacterium RIFCSPHIGHO2_12_FULL_63_22]|nr:MAG: hypothetical protein A3E01_04560 [Gammaproteobacteria bacterium RIFCSPHIGHO2_12_FULL_63_22]
MKQRSFPWISSVPEPRSELPHVIAQCTSYGMAARLSLQLKPGGPWSDSWLAQRLGVKSRGHMSRLLNDKQPMPRWMLTPIAYATGSKAILQYDQLQRALRITAGETQRDAVMRLAQQARAA